MTYIDYDNDGKIDKLEWVVPSLSEQIFEVTITVLNVQSYPMVGGTWTVNFTTTGKANLIITAINGTTFGYEQPDDLQFSELKCGDNSLNPIIIGNSILVENYECSLTGSEKSIVMTPGVHILEFRFGDYVVYAFNTAWQNETFLYRKEINITNTYDNLTEYQVQMTVDTASLIAAKKMEPWCQDIRFFNSTGGSVPYYIDESPGLACNKSTTLIWVQVPFLLNGTNTIDMYYGNTTSVSSASDEFEVFNYTTPKPIYYMVGENVYGDSISFVAFQNNTIVNISSGTDGTKNFNLNAGGIGAADCDITCHGANAYLNVTAPIFGGDNSNSGDSFNPISWAGTTFVNYNTRNPSYYYFYSPFCSQTITVYKNLTTDSSWTKLNETIAINRGGAANSGPYTGTTDVLLINGTCPFLTFMQQGGTIFNTPLYPVSNNLWGPSDTYVIINETDTLVERLANGTGNTTSVQNMTDLVSQLDGTQGSGSVYHFSANKTALGGRQTGDGDGSEESVMLPEKELDKLFYFFEAGEYLVGTTTNKTVGCNLYNTSALVSTNNAVGSTNNYPWPSKICIGCGSSTDNTFVAGGRLECNGTAHLYGDDNGGDEETFYGLESGRQYVWPEPVVSFGTEERIPALHVTLSRPANNTVDTDGVVSFVVNVSDNQNIKNVSLYGNFSGTWLLNQTDFPGKAKADQSTTLLVHLDGNTSATDGTTTKAESQSGFLTGKFWQAVNISVTGDNLNYSATNKLDNESSTIEMWVNSDWDGNDGANHYFASYYRTGMYYVQLLKTNTNNLECWYRGTYSIDKASINVSSSWSKDTWYYIGCTWNHVTNLVNVYFNDQNASKSVTSFHPFLPPDVIIGNDNDASGTPANALIDDIRLSNVSQTQAEMNSTYQNGTALRNAIVEFNLTISQSGNYTWNALAYDNDSNMAFAPSNFTLNVEATKSVAVQLSDNLSTIAWTVNTIPAIDLPADGNNGTQATYYFVNISATGTTADLYVKADGNLTSDNNIITLNNMKVSYNTSDSTVPPQSNRSITLDYNDNLIGTNLQDGTVVYLKFFLNVTGGQPMGTYNNTVNLKAVPYGDSP